MGIEDRVERVLAKLKLNKFYPFPFARSGFWQTVYGFYFPSLKANRPDEFHHVTLPDGDILVVAENRPKTWQPGQRIVVLVHGLTGCYESGYMQRMCRRMYKKGFLVLRVNLRFSGPGRGLAKNPYHGGVSGDTRFVLEWIKQRHPTSPVTQVGFSLGGNVTLKMAGEDGSRPSGNLDSVVAVSPPVDLAAAAARMQQPENRVFHHFFMKHILKDVKLLYKQFPEHGEFNFPADIGLKEFDEQFTALHSGFGSAEEYYKKSSSIYYVPEIKIPTLILSSVDDPVVDSRQISTVPHKDNIDILLTEKGGHVGFLGFGTEYQEVRWSDQAVARWIEDTFSA